MLPLLVSREDTFSLTLLKRTSHEALPRLNEVGDAMRLRMRV